MAQETANIRDVSEITGVYTRSLDLNKIMMKYNLLRKIALTKTRQGQSVSPQQNTGLKPIVLVGIQKIQNERDVDFYWLDSEGKHFPGKLILSGGESAKIRIEVDRALPIEITQTKRKPMKKQP